METAWICVWAICTISCGDAGWLVRGTELNYEKYTVFDTGWKSSCETDRADNNQVKTKYQKMVDGTELVGYNMTRHGVFWHPEGMCSCVLITQCTVVTAKHCIDPILKHIGDATVREPVIEVFRGKESGRLADAESTNVIGLSKIIYRTDKSDVAILHLRIPIDGITELPIRDNNAEPLKYGDRIQTIGFGDDTIDKPLTRQIGTALVSDYNDYEYLSYSAQPTRHGDSGGAVLFNGQLIGINSKKLGKNRNITARVDILKPWIDEWRIDL